MTYKDTNRWVSSYEYRWRREKERLWTIFGWFVCVVGLVLGIWAVVSFI